MNIEKLAKWAQKYIRDIERQRDVAIRALNEYIDNQTKSPIYIDALECTGEEKGPSFKRRYIQSHKISIQHEGVNLRVILRDGEIDISWSINDNRSGDVAFIPSAYQAARLVNKNNMRS